MMSGATEFSSHEEDYQECARAINRAINEIEGQGASQGEREIPRPPASARFEFRGVASSQTDGGRWPICLVQAGEMPPRPRRGTE